MDKRELQNVRSDFYETMDNVGMFWQIPNIQAFQSVVPGSIYTFYPSVGVTRDVGSRPETKYYGLRSLLSVKYLFDSQDDSDDFQNDEGKTKMPGYKYINEENGFKVFENRYYIPYGFWYDEYITEKEYYDCEEDDRHLLLLKAMVVKDEDSAKTSEIMTHADDLTKMTYDVPSYKSDCNTLKGHACQQFEYGKESFHAQITTPADGKDKLVFFSVPYESGWSATVNGEPAEIQVVNVGFMAVKVPAGSMSMIDFRYKTPGLLKGALVTAVAIVLYIIYIVVSAKKKKLKPRLKLKKNYKVLAIGSDSELEERYKNLHLGRNPMKKRKLENSENSEAENMETEISETENLENIEKDENSETTEENENDN